MISPSSTGTESPLQRGPRPMNRPALPSKLSNVNLHHELGHIDDPTAATPSSSSSSCSSSNKAAYNANGLLHYAQAADMTHEQPKEHIPPHLLSQRTTSLPLPRRPQSLAAQPRSRQPQPHTTLSSAQDPSTRANGLQPPPVATALPRNKVADFHPWTGVPGMHPEDVLTENIIKSGYVDKPSGASQTESNMARPHLWPSLKNKNGLNVLSALFVQVLDRRAQMGLCTAPSTFKPPPRVTLTDTKREAWLKDLANPQVPLRRLSRTIPHGIRGKVLLDHCITKDIPIARAVWLSKCVGANEIRAFKRKGVSGSAALAGELKWIREWTVFVEQFVEAVISNCGQPAWSQKMNYAVCLATHFYTEHLLDEEHYINWLLSSLHQSSSERLPVWILFAQIYWKHLISQRQRGRRLSEALLAHAKSLSQVPYGVNNQLINRIHQLIIVLAVNHRGCLVLPKTWDQYKSTFVAIKPKGGLNLEQDAMASVLRRNNRVLGSAPMAASRTPKLQLLDVLDCVHLDVHVDRIAAQCDKLGLETQAAMVIVLEWASSRHRCGIARIYLAAQLIRYWSFAGNSADEAVLVMLEKVRHEPHLEPESIYKIVSSLARSGHFSVGKYLQWLISMGVLSGASAAVSEAQLLLELPTAYLSSHITNLRRTLLARIGYDAEAELHEIENHKIALSEHLGGMSLPSPGLPSTKPVVSSNPVGAVKIAVAQWLCERVVSQSSESSNDTIFNGNLAAFCLVRQTLEQFEDFPSLARIIIAASTSNNPQILAAAVDTANLHIEVFATMGFLTTIVSHFYQQQRRLRARQPLDRTFLMSLSSLIHQIPSDAPFLKTVDGDLAMCEIQSSAAACSPASDSMAVSTSGSLESDDDIDRVLVSGNTMDEQLMVRMFSTIADRSVKMGLEGTSRAGTWFAQLRLFDQTAFEQLVHRLVLRLTETAASFEAVDLIMTALVGSGCMKLEIVYQSWGKKINTLRTSDPVTAGGLAVKLLGVLTPSNSAVHNQAPEAYRFRVAQKLFVADRCRDMLYVIDTVISLGQGPLVSTSTESPIQQKGLSLLRQYIIKDHAFVAQALLTKQMPSIKQSQLQSILGRFLNGDDATDDRTSPVIEKVNKIVASATELSLPFCQLALQQCSSTLPEGGIMSDQDKSSLMQTFQAAIEHTNSVWPQLLSALDKTLIYQIHSWAGECVMESITSIVTTEDASEDEASVQRYLRAVEVSASPARSHAAPSNTFVMLTEQLKRIGHLAEGINPLDIAQVTKRSRVSFAISVLLQLTTMHYHTLQDANSLGQDLALLVSVLCALLVHPRLQGQQVTLEQILDTASMMSDDLSNEHMQTVLRQLPPQARAIPRLRYLFGTSVSTDAWLALASRIVPQQQQNTSTPQATNSPVSASSQSPSILQRPWPVPQRSNVPSRQSSVSSAPSQPQAPNQPQLQTRTMTMPGMGRAPVELKQTPFQLRNWEIMPDPTPNMGLNDTSLSLGLFQARKCV